MNEIKTFFLDNGVGQNLTASIIVGVLGLLWGELRVLPKIRSNHREILGNHDLMLLHLRQHLPLPTDQASER